MVVLGLVRILVVIGLDLVFIGAPFSVGVTVDGSRGI